VSRTFGASSFCFNDADGIYSEQVAYTVALWVNRAAITTEQECFSEGSRSSTNPLFILRTGPTSGKAAVSIRNNAGGGSNPANLTTALTVFDGTWHHLAFAQDAAGNFQVYVDGVADGTAHGTFVPGATTMSCVAVGAFRSTTTANTFNTGSCAHVATWSRQLAATEIASLAGGLLPSVLGPVHYWPLWGIDAAEPDLGSGHAALSLSAGPTAGASNPRTSLRLLTV